MASLLASSTPLVSVTPDQDRTIPTSKRHREGLFLIPKNLLQIAIKKTAPEGAVVTPR